MNLLPKLASGPFFPPPITGIGLGLCPKCKSSLVKETHPTLSLDGIEVTCVCGHRSLRKLAAPTEPEKMWR